MNLNIIMIELDNLLNIMFGIGFLLIAIAAVVQWKPEWFIWVLNKE